jgi:hypothetical protein
MQPAPFSLHSFSEGGPHPLSIQATKHLLMKWNRFLQSQRYCILFGPILDGYIFPGNLFFPAAKITILSSVKSMTALAQRVMT